MEPHWAWLSLGVLLAAAEIVAPGFFLIWVGAAAVVTGVIAWVVPLSVPLQLGIFAALSFVALYGGRRWMKANPITTTDRSEEHTSELQSLMSNSYAVFCLKKKKKQH